MGTSGVGNGNGNIQQGALQCHYTESPSIRCETPVAAVDNAPITHHPPGRRVLSLVVVPLIALVVASNTAFFLWASLVDTHPLWLLTLSSQNRYLALTTNSLDAWSFFSVGALRLLAPDPLFYLLGLWYGVRAIDWMERRAPSLGMSLRFMEKGFGKARYLIVFLAPNNPVSLLAGATAMRPAVFAALNVSGTFARLLMIRLLGNVFQRPLDAFLGFVKDYRWYLIAGSVALSVLSSLSDRRRGGGEMDALRHLSEELTESESPAGSSSPPPEGDARRD